MSKFSCSTTTFIVNSKLDCFCFKVLLKQLGRDSFCIFKEHENTLHCFKPNDNVKIKRLKLEKSKTISVLFLI